MTTVTDLPVDRSPAAQKVPQPSLDLHRLEQFVAVVEAGSLTDAASRLGVTQQALSVAIRGLEKQVGITLFVRGRGMRPSTAGRHLYESALILLAAARRIVPDLRTLGQDLSERLTIGHTPAISSIDVVDVVIEHLPATAQLRTECLSTTVLRDQLFTGQIDIAMRRGVGTPRGLGNAIVGFNRLNAAVRSEMLESLRRAIPLDIPVRLADFAGLPLLLWAPESQSQYSSYLLAQCRRLGFEPQTSVSRFQGNDPVSAPLASDRGFSLVTQDPGTYLSGRITVVPLREKVLAPIQALWLPTSESGLVGAVTQAMSRDHRVSAR